MRGGAAQAQPSLPAPRSCPAQAGKSPFPPFHPLSPPLIRHLWPPRGCSLGSRCAACPVQMWTPPSLHSWKPDLGRTTSPWQGSGATKASPHPALTLCPAFAPLGPPQLLPMGPACVRRRPGAAPRESPQPPASAYATAWDGGDTGQPPACSGTDPRAVLRWGCEGFAPSPAGTGVMGGLRDTPGGTVPGGSPS